MGSEGGGDEYDPSNVLTGITMTMIYLVIAAVQANTEELILRTKAINVQRMIGLEGLYGIVWSFMACIIFSYVPCVHPGLCDVSFFLSSFYLFLFQILTF